MAVIEAKDFNFTYPGAENRALKGIGLAIERGEVLGVIGPVGAGKTTLCMAIAGFAPRIIGGTAAGEMRVRDSGGSSPDQHARRPVGMVFEDYAAQLTQLKAQDEVSTPLMYRGATREDAEAEARRLLERVGLDCKTIKDKHVWELSAGEQQRLAIAATLAIDPSVLILDNVMDRLDPRGRRRVREIMANLARDKTLLLVHHNAETLMDSVDRVLVMVEGAVVATGAPKEILRDYGLLERADIEPTPSLKVARALGLDGAPITPDELRTALAEFRSRSPLASSTGIESSEQPELQSADLDRPVDNSPRLAASAGTAWQALAFANSQAPERNRASDRLCKPRFGRALIRFREVCFQYPDRTLALDGVNLEVRAGEVHAVTGASGSGKTTLLNHVLGLLQPNEGKVSLCGTDTRRIPLPEIAKIVGGVLQNPDGQISEANVRDEIGSPLRYRQYERTGWFSKRRRYSDQYIDARIAEACDELGLALELLDQDPILLSSGLRKLVVTAETLAMDPAVLLLDEPTVGLGSSHRARLAGLLEKLREQGKAVLFADNDVDFIAENADQITVLHEGQVAFQGTVHQVFAEDHWDVLDELQIPVPRVARLARELGVEALRMDELIGKLA